MTRQAIFFSLFLSIISIIQAQTIATKELFQQLKTQDSIFFEKGFNRCNINYLETHTTDSLKFYHDQSGFQNKEVFLKNIHKFICPDTAKKPIRKVEENSLKVFPLYQNGKLYGAIQTGIHHFYIREANKEDVATSSAKFTHVWLLDNGTWKITEVLSYDHKSPEKAKEENSLTDILRENKIPALGLGIIKNGVITKIEIMGTLDKKTTAPYNTIFKVASLTKPIVALTTLRLADKGLLDLDEPLYNYWVDPEVKNDKRHRKLTPRIVISHQTGFPNWRYLTENNQLTFQFEPGTAYQYSGEGFEYLRKALENKFKKPLEQLAEEQLFIPLGMKNTHFWWNAEVDETRYAQNFDAEGQLIPLQKHKEANAAANLLTTVEDYSKFVQAVLNESLLTKELATAMKTPQLEIQSKSHFGLGWELISGFSENEIAILHSGKDPGVSTLAVLFPNTKNGYIIFMNGDNVLPAYKKLLSQLYKGNELWNKQ